MWMITLGFGLATLLLAWQLFGYVVWLRFAGYSRTAHAVAPPRHFPRLSVVIPCLNEEKLIVSKYRNLTACTYPPDQLEIVFVDGGSTDGTVALLRNIAEGDPRVRVMLCQSGGKIHQLNAVLPTLRGEVVMVTDADARLDTQALYWIAAEFECSAAVAVVGAFTRPCAGLAVERCFWAAQNRVRLMESNAGHASLVIACCYAFRSDLLTAFPADVVADDVYIAALANSLGRQTKYTPLALVEELRTPQSLPEFFMHKARKSNAVLREMLRFAYRLADMPVRWKSILATRIVQQLLLPWCTVIWLAMAVSLVNLGQIDVVALSVGLLFTCLLATRKACTAVKLPDEERFSVVTLALAYAYTMAVMIFTGLSYLSLRQTSRYARLGETSAVIGEPAAPGTGVRSATMAADEVLPRAVQPGMEALAR